MTKFGHGMELLLLLLSLFVILDQFVCVAAQGNLNICVSNANNLFLIKSKYLNLNICKCRVCRTSAVPSKLLLYGGDGKI